MNLIGELGVVDREVGLNVLPTGPARVASLSRVYHGSIDELWAALTEIDRLCTWFVPVTGTLRVGGHYEVEGNAFGQVRVCDAPRRFQVTWNFGAPTGTSDGSLVEVNLTPMGDRTRVRLEHTAIVPESVWEQFGPGVVGVGWDLVFLGLAGYIAGVVIGDVTELSIDPGMRNVMAASSEAWGQAYLASGATPQEISAAVAATTAFYVPPQEA